MINNLKSYASSEAMLTAAEEYIPLGSQTFSKSVTQYPKGVSPFFAASAKGAEVTDVDGNVFIDFVSALGAVTLGYSDPDVNEAVKKQLELGSIFTLSSELEQQVAHKITSMVPCAEKVRFGKNGSDATSACVRLARAFTKREVVLVGGYHGWQDWYIGTTQRSLGVPESTKQLTKNFIYNDLESLSRLLESNLNQVAAVVLEPVSVQVPFDGYLDEVKRLTHEHGALLVFDEVVSGFRHAKGGAQELYGVNPDLVALGKGLSNGMPLSAVAGKAEIMDLLEEVYFSFTYGGETLSLAAALASLEKLEQENVTEHLSKIGSSLIEKLTKEIERHDLEYLFSVSGHPVLSFLIIQENTKFDRDIVKTLFLQTMMDNGILALGSHVINFSHTPSHIDALISAYKAFFEIVSQCDSDDRLESHLRCDVLRPLFSVRK